MWGGGRGGWREGRMEWGEGGGREGSDQDVREEEEGEPVCEHLLSNRLSSAEEQLWVRLGHRLTHQL